MYMDRIANGCCSRVLDPARHEAAEYAAILAFLYNILYLLMYSILFFIKGVAYYETNYAR